MIKMEFRKSDVRRWLSALSRVNRRAQQQAEDITRRHAIRFKMLIRSNIMSQKYPSPNPPYNERYLKWKIENAPYKTPWKMMGNIYNTITEFKALDGKGWYSGIPASAPKVKRFSMYRTIKSQMQSQTPLKEVDIAMYARTLEFGIGKQKKRAVFAPTLIDYRKDIAPTELLQSKNKIRDAWR